MTTARLGITALDGSVTTPRIVPLVFCACNGRTNNDTAQGRRIREISCLWKRLPADFVSGRDSTGFKRTASNVPLGSTIAHLLVHGSLSPNSSVPTKRISRHVLSENYQPP